MCPLGVIMAQHLTECSAYCLKIVFNEIAVMELHKCWLLLFFQIPAFAKVVLIIEFIIVCTLTSTLKKDLYSYWYEDKTEWEIGLKGCTFLFFFSFLPYYNVTSLAVGDFKMKLLKRLKWLRCDWQPSPGINLNVRGTRRIFEIFQSLVSHYRVFLHLKCHESWMDAPSHLLPFPHVKAFERSTKMRSLSIERVSWWRITTPPMIPFFNPEFSIRPDQTWTTPWVKRSLPTYTDVQFGLEAMLSSWKIFNLFFPKDASTVMKLKRAFQPWHFALPPEVVGYLRGSAGLIPEPKKLRRFVGKEGGGTSSTFSKTSLSAGQISQRRVIVSSVWTCLCVCMCLCACVWEGFITLIRDGKWISRSISDRIHTFNAYSRY